MNKTKKSKSAGCLYTAGAMILGIWFLGKIATTTSPRKATEPLPISSLEPATTIETPTPRPKPKPGVGSTVPSSNQRLAASSSPPSMVPTPLPIVSTPLPARPRVRSASEISRIQKYVPSEITLNQDVRFPITQGSREIGIAPVGKGARAKVVGLSADKLLLDYNGRRQTVPITVTDFVDRMIAEAEK